MLNLPTFLKKCKITWTFCSCMCKSDNFAQVSKKFRRRTTIRRWHLETLCCYGCGCSCHFGFYSFWCYYPDTLGDSVSNRPGVAGAVQISSKHCQSQTRRARELKFKDNVHPTLCVMCHVLSTGPTPSSFLKLINFSYTKLNAFSFVLFCTISMNLNLNGFVLHLKK